MKREQFLTISSIVQFALFIPLAWWARKHPRPPVEIAFSRLVQKKQRSFMRSFVLVFNTITGSAIFLNVLVMPVAAILWKVRLRLEALMILATCWTNTLARTGIKQLVDRPRPNPLLLHITKQSAGKSFPSGHVASAMSLWGWLFALELLKKEVRSGRTLLLGLPALFVALVGPARIYLGDHWATDVLGGYLFGGSWLALSLRLYLGWRERGVLPGVSRQDESRVASSASPHTPDRTLS